MLNQKRVIFQIIDIIFLVVRQESGLKMAKSFKNAK